MLRICVLTGVLFTGLFASPHQASKGLLEWNEFYELQWSDFKGSPSEESNGDAGTMVQIKAKPYLVKKKVRYDVYAYFDKSRSWYRDTSSSLLAHEQLHFDIAELYARKIRKKVAELNKRNEMEIKVYNTAINQILEESNAEDIRYDAETLHGSMVKRQAAWEKKVEEELTRSADYKRRKKVISGD